MKLLNIIDEDIVNYKKTSMYIALPNCSMKCDIDCGKDICQNRELVKNGKVIDFDGDALIQRYLSNPITKAIVFGGLEPFDSPFAIVPFVTALRNKYNCDDDVVIYTGYTEDELEGRAIYSYPNSINQISLTNLYKSLKQFDNIIVKFGRFVPEQKSHYDEVLGVNLASDNQYAKVI